MQITAFLIQQSQAIIFERDNHVESIIFHRGNAKKNEKKNSHTFSIHSSKYTEECWFRDGVKRFTTVLEEEMWIHHNNSARLPFYRFINPFIHVYAEECEKFEISTNLLVNALSRSRWRFRIQWIVVKWWWCKNEWEGNKKSTHIHHSTEMFW